MSWNRNRILDMTVPPSLQNLKLMNWLRALLRATEWLFQQFQAWAGGQRRLAALTCKDIELEAYLNDVWDPVTRRIYIGPASNVPEWQWWWRDVEVGLQFQQPVLRRDSEAPPWYYIYTDIETGNAPDFALYLPNGVYTSNQQQQIKARVRATIFAPFTFETVFY